MTADEIRYQYDRMKKEGWHPEVKAACISCEIAAQLAELNEQLRSVACDSGIKTVQQI